MNKYDYKDLTPFKWFVLENFPFIEADFDAITNYQLYSKVVEYLNKTIESVNNIGNTVEEFTENFINLKNYVDNYFSNLDVQEEINNKLDEMTESGELTYLIKQYIDPLYSSYETEINNTISNQNTAITNLTNNVNNQLNAFDNRLSSVANGSPKGVYASLSALTTADPDHDYIYVTLDNGHWYYYNTTTSTWADGGTYQSASNPINPIYYDLTTYFPLNNNGIVDYKGSEYDYSSYKKTNFIPVLGNKLHLEGTMNNLTTDVSIVAFFSFDKVFIGHPTLDLTLTSFDIDIPNNCYYIKISTHNNNVSSTTYNFYNQDINIDKLSISKYIELREEYPNNITGYVNTDGTIKSDVTSFKRTDYIPCAYKKLLCIGKFKSLTIGTYVTCFDNNKNFIETATVDTTSTTNEIELPDNCYYVIITNNNSEFIDYYFYNSTIDLEKFNKTFYDINYSAFAGFKKFGVIGDSLSVGYMQDSNHVEYPRNIYYSWPQYLARYLGNTALNFGASGQSTKTWYNNQYHGFVEYNNPHNYCQAYIIGLGANDTGTIGSINDINWSNRDLNTDSFYGNYGKILQAINTITPNAKIFVLTLPYPRINNNKNNAIRELAQNEHLNNITLIDLENDYNNYFTNSNIKDLAWAMHFTASGYSNIAKFMNYALNNAMVNNHNDFIDIFKIPYGDNDIIN